MISKIGEPVPTIQGPQGPMLNFKLAAASDEVNVSTAVSSTSRRLLNDDVGVSEDFRKKELRVKGVVSIHSFLLLYGYGERVRGSHIYTGQMLNFTVAAASDEVNASIAMSLMS